MRGFSGRWRRNGGNSITRFSPWPEVLPLSHDYLSPASLCLAQRVGANSAVIDARRVCSIPVSLGSFARGAKTAYPAKIPVYGCPQFVSAREPFIATKSGRDTGNLAVLHPCHTCRRLRPVARPPHTLNNNVEGAPAVKFSSIACLFLVLPSLGATGTATAAEPNANARPYATQSNPETLVLDARDAGRGLMTATMRIPVAPGPFTLVYPEWTPGEHGPTGPLADLSQIRISANGRQLDWRRDAVDMFAFHVDVPRGTRTLDVVFTVLVNSPDMMSTPNLAILNWNRVLFYQADTNSHQVYFKPSIILPDGWGYGTALPGPDQTGQRVDFAEVPLNMLVDSPLDCGRYYKHIELWRQGSAYHMLDVFADKPQDLEIPDELIAKYRRLAPEALALYGSRHWNDYHSLLELSDVIGFQGIEHHQSSDNRAPDDFMTNPKD